MKSFKENKNIKKFNKTYVFGFIILLVCVGISAWLITNKVLSTKVNYDNKEITVLVARDDIKPGTNLSPTLFESTLMQNNFPENDLPVKDILEIENGMVINYISKGEILKKSNIISAKERITNDDRLVEHTFNEGALPTTTPDGSIKGMNIDVVLEVPNGDDKIVISKKKVLSQEGNRIGLSLNKSEMENLKEAAIEDGLSLYVIAYLYDFQTASDVTYVPNFMLEGVE